MPNREVRLLATVAAALLVVAAIAGMLFSTAVAYPMPTIGTLLVTAGLGACSFGSILRRRERSADRAAGIKWRRYFDDALSDDALAWAVNTWSRK